ncbi:MAG: hypothetical protein AAGE80_00010 [Pseudomonadota bacterium]
MTTDRFYHWTQASALFARRPLVFFAAAGVIFAAHAFQTDDWFIALSAARFTAIVTAAGFGYALLQRSGYQIEPGTWVKFACFIILLYVPVLSLGFVFFGPGIPESLGIWMIPLVLALVSIFAAGQILLGAVLAGIVETGKAQVAEGFRRAKGMARHTGRALVFGPWIVNGLIAVLKVMSHQAGLPDQPFDPVTGAFLWAWLPVNALQAVAVIFAALLTSSILHRAWVHGGEL